MTDEKTPPEKAKQDEGPEPMLDLSTLTPKRQIVAIDDKPYELKVMADFGIADQQELNQNGAEYDRLWNKRSLTKAERARMKLVLDKMVDKVLDAPPKVIAKLSDAHRGQIVLAFTLAPLVTASETAQKETAPENESESTTES